MYVYQKNYLYKAELLLKYFANKCMFKLFLSLDIFWMHNKCRLVDYYNKQTSMAVEVISFCVVPHLHEMNNVFFIHIFSL